MPAPSNIAGFGANAVRGRARRWRMALACLGLAAMCGWPAQAQDSYPSRNIKLVVSFPPGGGIDVIGRLYAERMSAILQQTVFVENRGGAAGALAGKQVAGAAPDGYTVLVGSNSMVINQILHPKSGLDVERDLVPVASVARQAIAIVAAPDFAVASLKEFLERARAQSVIYGTPGAGSIPHLLIEQLAATNPGVQATHVPFQGAAGALTAAMANQVQIASTTLPPVIPLVKGGKLRGLAVTTTTRSSALPEVPTTAEAGFPAILGAAWAGIFVPAKTPKPVVAKLEAAVLQVAAMPDVKDRLNSLGLDPELLSSEAFREYLAREVRNWTEVVANSSLKPR